MKITIFYSWQTSTETKYNKNFINTCIEKAIQKVKKKPEFQAIDFNLLEGVRNEPGSPPVASKIIDERIPNCDIFIADLSVVSQIPKLIINLLNWFGYKIRPAQNNNVINEHGVAYNALGFEKIIGVLNEAYGSPNDNPENISFDLRHLRFPIKFNYSKKTKNKEDIQIQLVNDLSDALKTTAIYALQHQRDKYSPLQVWSAWGKSFSTAQRFFSNYRISEIKDIITTGIKNPNESIRLLGLSGLGKTRILFEIFRPFDEFTESTILSSRVLYINCFLNPNADFQTIFRTLEKKEEDRIVILDNCTKALHRSVLPFINNKNNRISLITLDSNPEEAEHDRIDGVNYIIIKKEELSSVVNDIVAEDFSMLVDESKEKIKEFSQGIPLMAVLIGESIKKGEQFIGRLNDKDLLDRLLGPKGKEDRCRTILKSCSIFNYFGSEEDLRTQIEFIATEKSITSLDGERQVIINEFDDICNFFLKREIFERKGRLIGMRPFPLALYLAQEWLESCNHERLMSVLLSITKLPDRDKKQLTEAFSEQMKYLGYSDKAVLIVDKIVGVSSPFDNAEVLNTELGSRLFRSFVEVNPVAVSNNLVRLFSTKTIEELLQIVEGRRNLVWVLEKLCFDKRTFLESAKIMYAFAVAENETWSNNATGQFLHLFNIILSGTEANLDERWQIIQWGLNKSETKYHDLALRAMAVGLTYGHFSRTGGAEKQGSKVLHDYQPPWKEVAAYWTNILNTLKSFIITNGKYTDVASETIGRCIRSSFNAGLGHIVIPFISEISEFKNHDWDEALNGLLHAKKFEKNSIAPEQLKQIDGLILVLKKTDFRTRYSQMSRSFNLEDDETYSTEKLKEAIIKLADEFIDTNLAWEEYFPLFYRDQQFYSFHFGKRIFEIIQFDSERVKRFLNLSIKAILSVDKQDRNISVMSGFISEMDISIKDYLVDTISKIDEISYLLFNLIIIEKDGKKYLDILFRLVDDKKCDLENFKILSHGNLISNLTLPELNDFCKKLFVYSERGYVIVFEILFGVSYHNKELFASINHLFKECVYKIGFNLPWVKQIDEYKWSKIICAILENPEEKDFASFINRSIIDTITLQNTYHLDFNIQTIYGQLIKKHFSSVWPYLSEALISDNKDYIKFYGLKDILGSHIGGIGLNVGILFEGDISKIFDWCDRNKSIAPERLASLVPIFAGNNNDYSNWHPIALRLIDEFGDINEVLTNLGANMGSFSWTGSIVPLLEGREFLFNKLVDHKIEAVSNWAKVNLSYLEKEINREKNRDEEMHII